jgi:hypothetical protein
MFWRRKNATAQEAVPENPRLQWKDLPLISTRPDGQRVHGERGPYAEDVYAAGLLPVWGLEAKSINTGAVAGVVFGERLEVRQREHKWMVLTGTGAVLGALRWRTGDSGKPHAKTGVMIVYPERGTLHVERAVLYRGHVIDIAGTVHPAADQSAS